MSNGKRDVHELRKQAEELTASQLAALRTSELEKDQLLYEMRAHQAELKLQNQDLRGNQIALQDELERYVHENLRQLEVSRHIVTVQEKERRQLALDLHDIVSPNMAAIKANLWSLRTNLPRNILAEVEPRLEDINTLLDDTISKLRELGNELRPVILDYLGLHAALESYLEQFAARTGVVVKLTGTNGEADGNRLSPEVESKLFRIAQEALTNSAKHAKAKKVILELNHDTRHGQMSISDDGVGFDPELIGKGNGSPGLGLLTMRERAEFVGGLCRIDSRPGGGTRVTVEF